MMLTREKRKHQNNECSMCPAMSKNKNHTRTAVCERVRANVHSKKSIVIYLKC